MSGSVIVGGHSTRILELGASPLTVGDVLDLARGRAVAQIASDPALHARIASGVDLLARLLEDGELVYGVTTGVGNSVKDAVSPDASAELSLNLIRLHGCGTGTILDDDAAACVLAVRIASLSRGYSGVRLKVLDRICELLSRRILPRIPTRGSVGASGDLTPLSYLAAVVAGEREVSYRGELMSAQDALREEGLAPIVPAGKESLAIMNGTSFTTALACLAHERALRLARFASALTAMASDVIRGNPEHFDARIFELKPYPGSAQAAEWIRHDLGLPVDDDRPIARLQDRYSIRCAPHVIGILIDSLEQAKTVIEIEINCVNDNPIIDGDEGRILHGGNFYAGHVGHALESIKTAVAGIADLLDRQLLLVTSEVTSAGLPENLAKQSCAGNVHHGFKAVTIATASLAAEALSLTMPASVFSRSTENHNQDKVPMAPLAAHNCLRILELAECISVMLALAYSQAVDLRGASCCQRRSIELRDAIREFSPTMTRDRELDGEIATLLERYRKGELPIGSLAEEN
ncbi:MAG: histidine ammonia-lyase [Deltaproteobacteria bacterium]|nr:MAG: histidine ammonia-lyase [Deltaproteobacteria bacterium]